MPHYSSLPPLPRKKGEGKGREGATPLLVLRDREGVICAPHPPSSRRIGGVKSPPSLFVLRDKGDG